MGKEHEIGLPFMERTRETNFVQNIQRHLCDHAQLALLRDPYVVGFGYGLLLTPNHAPGVLWAVWDFDIFISGIHFTGVTQIEAPVSGTYAAAAVDHDSGVGRK